MLKRLKLTQRDKRALTIGGVVILGVFLYLYVISPFLINNGNGSDEIDAQRGLLAKYRRTIAMEDRYQSALDQRKELGIDVSGRLISGHTPALAAAELSSLIRRFAEDTNVHINRENVNPAKQTGSHQKISLQLSISSDVIGLRDFLYQIQNDEKLLDVESLTVNSRVTRRGKAGRYGRRGGSKPSFSVDETAVELNVTMVVSGYITSKSED